MAVLWRFHLPCASSRPAQAGSARPLAAPSPVEHAPRRSPVAALGGPVALARGDSCVAASSRGDGDSDGANDSARLSDAITEAAAARVDLALSLQRERELAASVSALEAEVSKRTQAAERAVLSATTLLEEREAAAKKLQTGEADAELRRAAASAAARVRELESELAATTLRAERELRDALAQATADAAATLTNAVTEAKAVAAAAEARAAALQNQLAGSEELALRLTATLQAKASADNDVARLVQAGAALTTEVTTLRAARAAAEVRATDGEARSAAAERSVAERVKDTLAAAEACVAAAEAIKLETEQRAAAAAVLAAQELQAARTRAEVAEAELGRRELLLGDYAEAVATVASQRIELLAASQRISALETECAALREARAASDEAAATAQARALAAEAAVAADVERLVAANDEKWRSTDSMVTARNVQLPLELNLARADAAGAAATATAATEALKVLEASAERQRASLQRALESAELSLEDWKARAMALEAAAASDNAAAGVPGRLCATLRGAELRRLLAHGPRGDGDAAFDMYVELEEAEIPVPVE